MNKLPWNINRFLKKFNESNNLSKGCEIDYTLIKFDNELNLFKLLLYDSIQSGYDGYSKSKDYYFKPNDFLQVINDLKKYKKAEINLECFLVKEDNSSDHNYSTFTDNGECSIQKGIAKGVLSISRFKFKLNDFDIDFVYKETIYSKISDDGSLCLINKETLKEFVKF
jgi:hypothetical protein